jgi:bifunctional non-homologous end joining protein LigD
LLTRSGLDWTARFKPIAAQARAAYIDGEVAVLDDIGVSDFNALQEALSEGHAGRLVYFAFDLLHLNGESLLSLPLIAHKARLEELIGRVSQGGRIRYSEHVLGHGPEFFEQARRGGLEGILSKRVRSLYRAAGGQTG